MRKCLWIALLALMCSGGLQATATQQRRFTVQVTPEMLRHSRLQDVLYFVDVVYGAAILLILLPTRISARLRDIATRRGRWFFVAAMLYFVLFSLTVTLLEFPLSLYQGFVVPHQFDLTNQSFVSWMGDFVKEIAVNLLI